MTPYQEQKKKQQLMRTRALLFIGLCLVCSTNGIAQTDFSDIDARLRKIYRQDQEVRQQWATIVQTSNVDSIMSYQLHMSQTDSINQAYVFQLLDTHGWPQQVSDSAYNAIFLVVDHASIEAQKRYWPFIKEGSQKGDLSKADAATLQDRMLMREGKKPERRHGSLRAAFPAFFCISIDQTSSTWNTTGLSVATPSTFT